MRDIIVAVIVFGSLPWILSRPYIGVLVWSWLGYMNPHRMGWGFATNFPFAEIVALATLAGLLISREPKRIPWTREVIVLILFLLWMAVTTLFALEPDLALGQLEKVVKIQLMTFVTLLLMASRERLHLLAWAIALSIGFFGVKGGIFTILTGGGYHVQGPPGTFLGGNNEVGLAMLMVLPFMRYLQLQTADKRVRLGLMAAMLLTIVAILGTQSRGALVGLVAVGLVLIWKSPRRFAFLGALVIATPLALGLMPDSWWQRMDTIQDYQQDGSAMGRINAWWFAYNLASDRPLGGGFETFRQPWFRMYAPQPENKHDAHSIYFEVLGEHGYVGLMLFLLLGLFTWRSAGWVIRRTRGVDDLGWASNLARMLQVSLVAYATSGAFLGLAYFDLYYHIVAMVVLCRVLVAQELAGRTATQPTARPLRPRRSAHANYRPQPQSGR